MVSRTELGKIIADAKREGRRVVFTNGCFDILHPGHVRLLEAARDLGDMLIVALNTDRSVRTSKGANRPIIPDTRECILNRFSAAS